MKYDYATQSWLKPKRDFKREAIKATLMQAGIIGIIAALTVAYIYVLTN